MGQQATESLGTPVRVPPGLHDGGFACARTKAADSDARQSGSLTVTEIWRLPRGD